MRHHVRGLAVPSRHPFHHLRIRCRLLCSVVAVLDGDTIEVLHDRHPECIRLNGMDSPAKGQAYGTRAKQAVSALVYGKEVTLQTFGKDKYGHTLADVLVAFI